MVSDERRLYKAAKEREYSARKHGGISWPKGRPRKDRMWPPPPEKLHCIYCTMLIGDPYHIKNPCWKHKLSMIFVEKENGELL